MLLYKLFVLVKASEMGQGKGHALEYPDETKLKWWIEHLD